MAADAAEKTESLWVKGVSKSYPGITALDNVDLVLRKGEIHGLVGKNGAGKSTMVQILYGITNADSGTMEVVGKASGGNQVNIAEHSPMRARELGIYMVPQEPVFALDLTIEENFFMAKPLMKGLFTMNRREMQERAAASLGDFKLDYSPRTKIRDIPMEDRHLLYTALVVDLFPSEVVLLDEVTSALRKNKCDILFDYLARIKKDKTIVLITHRIKEVLEHCDVVTVFRNGRKIVTDDVHNLDSSSLADLIVGENVQIPRFEDDVYMNYAKAPEPLLVAENLAQEPYFRNFSLTLYPGEILGVTGLVESGVTQLLRCLSGVGKPETGRILFRGKVVTSLSPESAQAQGIVYGTNDRLNEGNFPDLNVMDNINACVWPRLAAPPFGFISRQAELENYQSAVNNFNLQCHSPLSGILNLSGGNQQKSILTRLIAADASVYVFDEPTKGIDVGTVYEILRYLRNNIVSGVRGVIVNLSSIEELMLVCDRVVTVVDGRIAREFKRGEFGEDEIFRSIQGVA
ncbi:MAG: sugar ABC transporter ATP-binding protein [Planctomycetes bacterium]|nr:sugar ABC transporter ATP-binding protein [Planctomycetota bacterium]